MSKEKKIDFGDQVLICAGLETPGGDPIGPVPATTTTAGIVKQSATQADSTATDAAGLVTDFNALLAKLKAAGIMA